MASHFYGDDAVREGRTSLREAHRGRTRPLGRIAAIGWHWRLASADALRERFKGKTNLRGGFPASLLCKNTGEMPVPPLCSSTGETPVPPYDSLTIDEHQNSIRGGKKQAKKISASRHILGGANLSRYWIYVYVKKSREKYFWQSGEDAEARQTGGTVQRSTA
jgi:hypothetical protein